MNRTGIQSFNPGRLLGRVHMSRGMVFGVLIIGALLAFEMFNYSTTDFALADLLGDLRFAGIRWATILAIAFCGIDFAGIARLFTPEQGADEPKEIWYLFGAWLLAATMNAMLTWWGVSIAIISHQSMGGTVVAPGILLKVVPVFVAIMVWLIRVLIIGTFSVAGERLFSQGGAHGRRARNPLGLGASQALNPTRPVSTQAGYRPAPKTNMQSEHGGYIRPEPSYRPASLSRNSRTDTATRR